MFKRGPKSDGEDRENEGVMRINDEMISELIQAMLMMQSPMERGLRLTYNLFSAMPSSETAPLPMG